MANASIAAYGPGAVLSGVLWVQGEANADTPTPTYTTLFMEFWDALQSSLGWLYRPLSGALPRDEIAVIMCAPAHAVMHEQ